MNNQILDGYPIKNFTGESIQNVNKNQTFHNGLIPDVKTKFDIVNTINDSINFDSEYEQDITAIKGNYEDTNFTRIFFSKQNIGSLQQSIRYYVYKKTNNILKYNQSENELYIIMRSILFQVGNFLVDDENMYEEIQNLNNLVINDCVNIIISENSMYEKYLNDVQNLQVPLSQSKNVSNTDNRELGHPYV